MAANTSTKPTSSLYATAPRRRLPEMEHAFPGDTAVGKEWAASLHLQDTSSRSTPDFFDFPEALGWEIDDAGNKRFTGRGREVSFKELAQHWLFFAVLKAAFGHMPDFHYRRFIDRRHHSGVFLSTAELQNFLTRLQQNVTIDKLCEIHTVLHEARRIVRTFCAARADAIDGAPLWSEHDVDKQTVCCAMVLGETLMSACSLMARTKDFEWQGWDDTDTNTIRGWGLSSMVLRQFQDRMCPRELHTLLGNCNESTTTLILAFVHWSRGDGKDHTQCDSTSCRAELGSPKIGSARRKSDASNLRQPVYRLAHIQRGCSCLPRGPTVDRIHAILETGNVPLVFRNSQGGYEVDEWVKGETAPPFVAITHAFCEGFGNTAANQISQCVAEKLEGILAQVSRRCTLEETPRLWLDTWCVPRAEEGQLNQAVRDIPSIYREAQATVVLSMDLLQTVAGTSFSSAAMKILLSQWPKRLWTLQEAFLSRNLLFAFDEGEKLRSMEELRQSLEEERQRIHDPRALCAYVFYTSIVGHMRHNSRFASPSGWKAAASDVLQVIGAVRYRQIECKYHEAVAYTSLLALSETEVLRIQSAEAVGGDGERHAARMAHFLSALSKGHSRVPSILPFLAGARLTLQDDYSWVPATWMTSVPLRGHLTEFAQKPATVDADIGIAFSAPGILLHKRDNASQRNPFQGDFDIVVQCGRRLDGNLYRIRFPLEPDTLAKRPSQEDVMPVWQTKRAPSRFFATDRENLDACRLEDMHFAIIATRLPPEGPRETAILVSRKETSTNSDWVVRRIGLVEIDLIHDRATIEEVRRGYIAHAGIYPFFGSALGASTQWSMKGFVLPRLMNMGNNSLLEHMQPAGIPSSGTRTRTSTLNTDVTEDTGITTPSERTWPGEGSMPKLKRDPTDTGGQSQPADGLGTGSSSPISLRRFLPERSSWPRV